MHNKPSLSARTSWLSASTDGDRPRLHILVVLVAGILALAWYKEPVDIPGFFLFRQDTVILCAMTMAAAGFLHLRPGPRMSRDVVLSPLQVATGLGVLLAICVGGHWLVMLGYDLSRDEAMATFAAMQLAHGTLVTPVPAEWQPYGRAMLPVFFDGRIDPHLVWTSAYLPVNSAFRAIAGAIADEALANPLLYVGGLVALWHISRRIWPERKDAAVVVVLLAATSTQLIVTAMTSYAMVGHFALNLMWLALFLRKDRIGTAGALSVGLLATGLHQFHFHVLFVTPFLFWLVVQREWKRTIIYGIGHMAIVVFWFKFYPSIIIQYVDKDAIVPKEGKDILGYIFGRISRFMDYSPTLYFANFSRFFAWQNFLLMPLAFAVWPVFRSKDVWKQEVLPPLAAACGLGLMLMVYQGHGWGYRYLSGLIGCFCLLAGYGWLNFVPSPGPSRAWVALKYACAFSILFQLPVQLAMARQFVAPYAELYEAALTSDADVVLVDTAGGFYAQDIVQNSPDFEMKPKIMDMALISREALVALCSSARVARIDERHYRAAGMLEMPVSGEIERGLMARRALLDRIRCAPPLEIE